MPNGKTVLPGKTKKALDAAQGRAILALNSKVNKLYKANQVNTHYIDVAQTITPGTTATIGHLTPVPENDTEQGRSGDKIALRMMDFRMTLTPNPLAANDIARFIVFKYKGVLGGTAPPVSRILEVPTNPDSPYNHSYRHDWTIVLDKRLDCSSVNGTRVLHMKVPLHNSGCTFFGAAGANFNENTLFFLVIFAENTNKTSMNYYSRVSFLP